MLNSKNKLASYGKQRNKFQEKMFGISKTKFANFCRQTSYYSYARPTQPGPNRTRLCGPCIAIIAGD